MSLDFELKAQCKIEEELHELYRNRPDGTNSVTTSIPIMSRNYVYKSFTFNVSLYADYQVLRDIRGELVVVPITRVFGNNRLFQSCMAKGKMTNTLAEIVKSINKLGYYSNSMPQYHDTFNSEVLNHTNNIDSMFTDVCKYMNREIDEIIEELNVCLEIYTNISAVFKEQEPTFKIVEEYLRKHETSDNIVQQEQ